MGVDYDTVAAAYSRRYEQHAYAGVRDTLTGFVGANTPALPRVLEVGCGTGHWLQELGNRGITAAGADVSAAMLQEARVAAPGAWLVRARAETLPWRAASFDRLVCVNALHHFADHRAFFMEARHVLGRGGGILIVSLDPHDGLDDWWIYDYFPGAKTADCARYLSSGSIRAMMKTAGFERCATREAERLTSTLTIAEARRRGLLERSWTSQLMVISDDQYREGRARLLEVDIESARATLLQTDLRLYATVGWCDSE
jgi:ubiquinone/menaquinone biosynthesis C-methylase UbiE